MTVFHFESFKFFFRRRGIISAPFYVRKSLIIAKINFFLKKVAKRFGNNDILYISLQRVTIHNKSKQ